MSEKNEYFSNMIKKKYEYYLYHPQVLYKNKRVRALYNRIILRPKDESFLFYIFEVLKWTLGVSWKEEQIKLPLKKQPYLWKCMMKCNEFYEKLRVNPAFICGDKYVLDGYTNYIRALAFDVYSLKHTNNLPEFMIKRLRNKDQYQGVRYELAIAAIFVRAGFTIEWLDNQIILEKYSFDKQKKRPDFIVTNKETGVKLVIETKSRHRSGVINQMGFIPDSTKIIRGDLGKLITDSFKKETMNIPYVICLDINSPACSEIPFHNRPYLKDISKRIDSALQFLSLDKEPYVTMYITNFSFHYDKQEAPSSYEYFAIYPSSETVNECFPNSGISEILNRFYSQMGRYGSIPPLD